MGRLRHIRLSAGLGATLRKGTAAGAHGKDVTGALRENDDAPKGELRMVANAKVKVWEMVGAARLTADPSSVCKSRRLLEPNASKRI